MEDFGIAMVTILIVLGLLSGMGGCVYQSGQAHLAQTDLKSLKEKHATEKVALQDKYNALSCKMRGLLVEQVEGIKLCMDPQTRALHKIDEVKDSK